MRTNTLIAAAGLLGTVLASAPATAAIVVDGLVGDWSVTVSDATPGTSNGSVYAPSTCPVGGSALISKCVGSNYDGFVDVYQAGNSSAVSSNPVVPGGDAPTGRGGDRNDWTTTSYSHTVGSPATGGGQNYDVDFMAAAVEGTKLVGMINSGQRADNGLAFFSPGDIRIQVTKGDASGVFVYGIEVGGGVGGGAGGAVSSGAADSGYTYTLNSNGHVVAGGAVANGRTVGDVVSTGAFGSAASNALWINDPINNDSCNGVPGDEVAHGAAGGECQVQLASAGGTTTGSASLFFTVDTFTTQHSIIEFSVDLSLIGSGLGLGDQIDIFWGPGCANDYDITVVVPGSFDIPAPAALPLFLLGLGGMGLLYRRRRAA